MLNLGTICWMPAAKKEMEKTEANQHVANHVTTQLDLIRSNDSAAIYEDEFEAQLDDK